jgi:hypothetical protein
MRVLGLEHPASQLDRRSRQWLTGLVENKPCQLLGRVRSPVSSQATLTPSFGASLRSAFIEGVRAPDSILLM